MPTTRVNGIDLHYLDAGRGPAIVFGHSLCFDSSMFAAQIERLSPRHRCVAVDFRGHGRTPRSPAPFTLEDQAEDVVGLMDALGIDRAIHVGLSMGGMTAMRLALLHPSRVAGLALMDTDAAAEEPATAARYEAMAQVLEAHGPAPLWDALLAIMFGPAFAAEQPAAAARMRDTWLASDGAAIVPTAHAVFRRTDVLARLGAIAVPTLVVVGEHDAATPPDRSRAIAAAIPGARLVTIAGAGHMTAVERPDAVNEALEGFVERVAP